MPFPIVLSPEDAYEEMIERDRLMHFLDERKLLYTLLGSSTSPVDMIQKEGLMQCLLKEEGLRCSLLSTLMSSGEFEGIRQIAQKVEMETNRMKYVKMMQMERDKQ